MLKRNPSLLFIVVLFMAYVPVSHADLVNATITGEVFSSAANPYGLSDFDAVVATLTYDDALVVGAGESSIRLDSDPSFGLSLSFGSSTFTELDDVDAGAPGDFGPQVFFSDGVISGLEFYAEIVDGESLLVLEVRDFDFDGDIFAWFELYDLDTSESLVYGEFEALASAPITQVPVLPAFPLFFSALVALGFLSRRR